MVLKIHSLVFLIFATLSLTAQSTEKLFSLLSPAQTGVAFENTVVDTKEHNILIYSNYYGGGGVGIGDFNNDGLQDIFFAGNLVADKLYLNKGNLQFEDITESAGIQDNGGWSSGVLVADINNDGWQDIYVTRELYDDKPELRRNKLYINKGDGTFAEKAAEYEVDDSERTRHATFLDYDKDGLLDLFLLNQPPNPGNYSELFGTDLTQEQFSPRLYRNTGKGKFTDVTKKAGLLKTGFPNSVSASDLNNDGWTDLYVANDYDAPDFLYLNNGDGTFTDALQHATRHISYYSMGVDVADINNDGWLDAMVLDMVAEDNYRLKANMSGMNPAAFWKVVSDGGHYQYMFNTLHLNQGVNEKGELILSDIAQLAGMPSTDWSWSNLFADFDNDGWKDVYVTNGLLRDIRNSDAAKSFPKYVQHVAEEFIKNNPNAGDVSIWEILDLEEALNLIPSVPLSNYAFKNNGDLTFTAQMDNWGLNYETFSNGSAYADLDNDGDIDLVVSNINAPAHIYRNNSEKIDLNNYLRLKLTDSDRHQNMFGVRVEICTDGKKQLHELTNVRGMYSTSEQTAHFGVGNAQQIDSVLITWPNGKKSLLQNIKTNQELLVDLATAPLLPQALAKSETNYYFNNSSDTGLDFIHKENNFDDFEKQVLLPHKMSQFGPALAVGDVDGDGLEDVYAGGAFGQAGQLFLQKKNGSFTIQQVVDFQTDANFEDVDAVFFDADKDGDLDLYVVSGGNVEPQQSKAYQDRLYLNNKGKFERAEENLPKFKDSGSCVRPFDFDADGDLDLFVGGRHTPWDWPAPAISRLLRNDGGKFTDITKINAQELIYLGLVTDAVWTDFDKDGQTDLVAVGEWMPITFFKNENGKLTIVNQKSKIENQTGWWYSITAADMDGDGDEDLLAGNLGLNYKYKASPEAPFEVHYDDFDANGSKDVVLSYYNFGEQYPLRGRSCSSEQIPELAEKFKTYDLFASATLDKVYGEDNLENALHYQAQTFASAYMENTGGGNFEVHQLPNEAQLSSINDFIVEDFNADGHKDVLLAGNLFTSEIETTRNDAGTGLLFLGNGSGEFKTISGNQSGFMLPEDVKHLKTISTSKGKYILCAVNDGALQVFKIQQGERVK